ncbi:MAG: TlpA family protein disulfide reductase [bacterium]|nr:TlpA family protein disulfide reductase [bacterium]
MTVDRFRSAALVALLLVSMPAATPARAEAAEAEVAEVGEPPPLFTLADEHGKVHRLEDYLGTPTVLYFTHNMCHYCTQIIAFLKRTRGRYSESELSILTVNVWAGGDNAAKFIRRYKEQYGLPFPMLAGKDPQLLRHYEVNYVPIIVFIGEDGRIHRIFHHYILKKDFQSTVREIVEGGQD